MSKALKAALAAAVAAGSLMTAGAAAADPYDRYERAMERYERDVERAERKLEREHRKAVRQEQKAWRKAARRYNAGAYYAPRGYAVREFYAGQRLPAPYRSSAYYVDYDRYGLGAPPYGYRYVRVGDDAVLTQVATGLIAQVVAGLFQ